LTTFEFATVRSFFRRIVLIVLVIAAAAPAFAARVQGQGDAPAFDLPAGWRLVQRPARSGDWAIAVAADAPAPPDLPRSMLLLAHREDGVWRVRSSATDAAAFDAWLAALPPALLSAQDREWFRPGDAARRSSAPAASGHRLPVPGGWTALMTQGPFGPFSHSTYWAIDLVLPYWGTYTSTIVATKPGVVIYVKDVSDVGGLGTGYSGYANGVVIRHGPSEYSWYWHLAYDSVPPDVQPGRAIEAGAVIGRMGSTGYSSGPHLHFHVTENFAMVGCDAALGCPARETRPNVAPWNRDIVAVDFEETADEATWTGCNSVASCGDLPPSANRLAASDGAVAYWGRSYDGPGWKMRAPFAGDLPGWLAGRARSLAVPNGWRVVLFDQPGQQGASRELRASSASLDLLPRSALVDAGASPPEPTATQPPLPTATPAPPPTATPVPLPTATAVPLPTMPTLRRIHKALRSDLASAWPYLLGGESVAAIDVNGHITLPGECRWMVQTLHPGGHALTFTLRSDAPAAAVVEAQRWPFAAPACMSAPADPGAMPLETPCYESSDIHEPNGGAVLATPLELGDAQVHRAALAGDVDWVTFPVMAGGDYALETVELGAAADTVLELIDADGVTVLARSDDADGMGRASRIQWRAATSGVRYARVRQWDPGAVGCGTAYTLRLREMRPRVWVSYAAW
jgi:hypothetical protein